MLSAPPTPAHRGWVASLFRRSALFLGLYGAGSVLSFGVHLLLARLLGANSYGHFVYATHWLAVLILLCTLGLKPTLVRFVSAYQARAEWGPLRGLLHSATRWTLLATLAVLTLSLAALAGWHPRLDERGLSLLLVALSMPFLALAEVWSSATRGLGAVMRSQLPASIAQHLLLALGLLMLLPLGGPGAGAAAGAFLAATVGSAALAWALLRACAPPALRTAAPQRHTAEWAGAAGSNLSIALLQASRAPLVVVIAGAWVDPGQLAFFVAASRLANGVGLGLTGISGPASPMIASLHALGDRRGLRRLAAVSAGGALAAGAAVALVLLLFGRELLGLFGPGFEAGFRPLMLLLAGEMAAAAVGPVGHLMVMTGRQRLALGIEALSSAVALVLAPLLIVRHGIDGAAAAMAGAAVLRNVCMAMAVWQGLGRPAPPGAPGAPAG